MSLIKVNIEIGSIPKEKFFKSDKTGKIYLNVVVAERQSPDDYKNTHTVYLEQTEEERKAQKKKDYVGSGKLIEFKQAESAPINDSDLPFYEDLPF